MNNLLNSAFEKGISFEEYFALSEQFAKEKKTSGDDQSDAMVNYSKLNFSRMKRVNKTVALDESTIDCIASINEPQKWVLISETWCGDAAQNLPLLAKLAEQSSAIDLRIVFRDENLKLIDAYLTNGGRSIPKLIAFTATEEIFVWGPRPADAQKMVMEYKNKPEPKESYDEFSVKLQHWYNHDNGLSLQKELCTLLNEKSLV